MRTISEILHLISTFTAFLRPVLLIRLVQCRLLQTHIVTAKELYKSQSSLYFTHVPAPINAETLYHELAQCATPKAGTYHVVLHWLTERHCTSTASTWPSTDWSPMCVCVLCYLQPRYETMHPCCSQVPRERPRCIGLQEKDGFTEALYLYI